MHVFDRLIRRGERPQRMLGAVAACGLLILPALLLMHIALPARAEHLEGVASDRWLIERVDSLGDVGMFPSIKMDGDNYPRITYYDASNGQLKYGYRDAWSWRTWWLAGDPVFGAHSDLALDAGDYSHVCYYDQLNRVLMYAYQVPIAWGWRFEPIASQVTVVQASLALGSGGQLHVLYVLEKAQDQELWYALRQGGQWSHTLIARAEALPSSALALDAQGAPHLLYSARLAGASDTVLHVAWRQGTVSWHEETLLSGADIGPCALTVGEAGRIVASCAFLSPLSEVWDMRILWHDVAGWHETILEQTGAQAAHNDLALDGAGWPHVSYHAPEDGDLRYAWQDALGWHLETVDADQDVGRYSALAIDGGGAAHILYYDAQLHDLKYARSLPQGDVTPTPTLATTYIEHREAEQGLLLAPMAIGSDPLASACRYVSSDQWETGAVTVTFGVPSEGLYYLWLHAMGLAGNRNSFFVAVDDGPEAWHEIQPVGDQWTWGWDRLHNEHLPSKPLLLTAGVHQVRFRAREILARLDAVVLTNDPQYQPGPLMPCEGTPTWTATPLASATAVATTTPSATLVPTQTPVSATPTLLSTSTPIATAEASATPTRPPMQRLYLPLLWR
jgi:hypothetical protein